jgi:GNAT superfamily N-acetyltransferase
VAQAAWTIRAAIADDAPFLADMLVESVNWSPARGWTRERILADADLARYICGWPRPTDLGVIAMDPHARAIGAAWLRYFDSDDHGYGFVGADVPELSIAVMSAWRGRGVGRALLREIHGHARRKGAAKVSLSVERANPAFRLYLSEGYRTVQSGKDSDTMLIDLQDPRRPPLSGVARSGPG